MTVSAVIIAKNEEENLQRCLASLSWCDDILVVDDHSSDGTVEVARGFGARVLTNRFTSFADQRNFALASEELRHAWVLMLDADEASTPEFRDAVLNAIENASESTVAFRTCRKTIFLNRWLKYSDGYPVWIMRLVRVGRARFVSSGHGEVAIPPVDGQIGTIRAPFLHYPFSKGFVHWAHRHVDYAEREAKLESAHAPLALRDFGGLFSIRKEVRRSSLRSISRWLPGRLLLRFFYQYVVKLGFLDGRAGLIFCCMMAGYEGLIRLFSIELQCKFENKDR
ncbi:MAG: glycosyltransferase family 2 protein [Pirellulales bacterium]